MPQVRVDVFGALRGLCVETSQIGSTIEFARNGFQVTLALPSDAKSWSSEIPDYDYLHISAKTPKYQLPAVVQAIKVSLRSDVTEVLTARSQRSYQMLNEVIGLAQAVLADFRGWVRVRSGQYWLGYHGEDIRLLGHSRLIDESSNIVLATTTYGRLVYQVGIGPGLDSTALAELVSFLGAAQRTDFEVGDSFLADARFLAQTGDHGRALVMAAVACEAKIKEVLRAVAPANCGQLLDVVLTSYREIPVAAAMLFDQVAKSVLGCSLRESDKKTFKSLQKLFELRNSLVHRGDAANKTEAERCVETAVAVFEWLGKVRAGRNT